MFGTLDQEMRGFGEWPHAREASGFGIEFLAPAKVLEVTTINLASVGRQDGTCKEMGCVCDNT